MVHTFNTDFPPEAATIATPMTLRLHDSLLDLLSSNGGQGVFNVRKGFSVRCKHEGQTGSDQYSQPSTRPGKKTLKKQVGYKKLRGSEDTVLKITRTTDSNIPRPLNLVTGSIKRTFTLSRPGVESTQAISTALPARLSSASCTFFISLVAQTARQLV